MLHWSCIESYDTFTKKANIPLDEFHLLYFISALRMDCNKSDAEETPHNFLFALAFVFVMTDLLTSSM